MGLKFEKGWDIEVKPTKGVKSKAWHFRLKRGESRQIFFIDDEPITIFEHAFFDGNYWRRTTCLRPDDCPFCMAMDNGVSLYKISYLTIWDCTDNRKKLFGMKTKTLSRIYEFYKEFGSLKGRVFKVTRTEEPQSMAVGEIFLPLGTVKELCQDVIKTYKDDLKPFDYVNELKPLSFEEAYQIMYALGKLDKPADFFDDEEQVSNKEAVGEEDLEGDPEIPF